MSELRQARQRANLKLHQAATKLGMTAATLRALEDGAFPPNPTEALAIRNLYGAEAIQGDLF